MPASKEKQGPTILRLLELIEEFMEENNLDNDGNYFGWVAIRDRTLVQRLRDGGDITTTKLDRIMEFMLYPQAVLGDMTLRGPVDGNALKPLIIKPRS